MSGGGGIDLLTPIVEGSSPFTRNQLLSARNRHSCGACRRPRGMCNTAVGLSREATMLLSGFTAAHPYCHMP